MRKTPVLFHRVFCEEKKEVNGLASFYWRQQQNKKGVCMVVGLILPGSCVFSSSPALAEMAGVIL